MHVMVLSKDMLDGQIVLDAKIASKFHRLIKGLILHCIGGTLYKESWFCSVLYNLMSKLVISIRNSRSKSWMLNLPCLIHYI